MAVLLPLNPVIAFLTSANNPVNLRFYVIFLTLFSFFNVYTAFVLEFRRIVITTASKLCSFFLLSVFCGLYSSTIHTVYINIFMCAGIALYLTFP